eukprot:4438503-Prymnesium_polylepis.1
MRCSPGDANCLHSWTRIRLCGAARDSGVQHACVGAAHSSEREATAARFVCAMPHGRLEQTAMCAQRDVASEGLTRRTLARCDVCVTVVAKLEAECVCCDLGMARMIGDAKRRTIVIVPLVRTQHVELPLLACWVVHVSIGHRSDVGAVMKVRAGLFHTPAEPRRGGLPCNICGAQQADALHALRERWHGIGDSARRLTPDDTRTREIMEQLREMGYAVPALRRASAYHDALTAASR